MTTPEKVYLGDGVYADEDGGMIKLTTARGDGEVYIYLEPEVFAKLVAYARQVWPPETALGQAIEDMSTGDRRWTNPGAPDQVGEKIAADAFAARYEEAQRKYDKDPK